MTGLAQVEGWRGEPLDLEGDGSAYLRLICARPTPNWGRSGSILKIDDQNQS